MNNVAQLRGRSYAVHGLFFLCLLCVFSIPLPIRINALIMVGSLAALLIYNFSKLKELRKVLKSPFFVLITIHGLIQVIGLSHSLDVPFGLRELERYSFALMFPLQVFLMARIGITVVHFVISLAAGCIAITIYGLIHLVATSSSDQIALALSEGHTLLADHMLIHPTYLSIYLTFVCFSFLEIFRTSKVKYSAGWKAAMIAMLCYIVLMQLLLRSQLGLLIFASFSVLYILMVMRRRAALVGFALVVAAVLTFFIDPDRIKTFLDHYGRNVSTALDNRLVIWNAAMSAVSTSPMWGAGTGGQQVRLNEEYSRAGYMEGVENSYNAHNQYLEFAVRNGILELLAFLAILVYGFYKSMTYRNYTFLLFNMTFSMAMIAESCLNVHKGVIFFYLFFSAFIYLPFGPEETAFAEQKE